MLGIVARAVVTGAVVYGVVEVLNRKKVFDKVGTALIGFADKVTERLVSDTPPPKPGQNGGMSV